ncbi:hypothetical protein [Ideonella sp. YS5]|uniref:hypothetical protein n=1 Tax=Ideonella sp. YS5 TaxID=3453714 RepID=UPI003EEE75C9
MKHLLSSVLGVSCCLAIAVPTESSSLSTTIQSSLVTIWRQDTSASSSSPVQSPGDERLQKFQLASTQAVACFRTRAVDYDEADVQLFEHLITQYQSIFATRDPDWENSVTMAIDGKFGQGASRGRSECQKGAVNDANCAAAKSFQAVGVYLYAELLPAP